MVTLLNKDVNCWAKYCANYCTKWWAMDYSVCYWHVIIWCQARTMIRRQQNQMWCKNKTLSILAKGIIVSCNYIFVLSEPYMCHVWNSFSRTSCKVINCKSLTPKGRLDFENHFLDDWFNIPYGGANNLNSDFKLCFNFEYALNDQNSWV